MLKHAISVPVHNATATKATFFCISSLSTWNKYTAYVEFPT